MHFHISWLGIWADNWSRVIQSEHEKCNIRSWKFNNSRYNPSINFKWFYRPLYTTWCKINDSYIAIIPVYVNIFLWFFRRKQTGQRGKPSTIVSLFRLYYFALQRNVLVLWSRVIVILLKKPISNAPSESTKKSTNLLSTRYENKWRWCPWLGDCPQNFTFSLQISGSPAGYTSFGKHLCRRHYKPKYKPPVGVYIPITICRSLVYCCCCFSVFL